MTRHRHAPSSVTPTSPLWVTGRALLARYSVDLFTCWSKARKTLDLDAIHDLRVASRRVRECAELFGPCYRSDAITLLGRKLKRLTTHLGAIRDTDEALLFMEGLAGEVSPHAQESLAALLHLLRKEREVEARRIGGFLRKTHRYSLDTLFQELSATPDLFGAAGIDPFMPVRRYVREALAPTLAAAAPPADAVRCESAEAAQHSWRIAVKKLRYRLEIVTLVLKSPPDEALATLKRYQELLGRLHDLDVHRDLVENLAPDRDVGTELLRIIGQKRSVAWAELALVTEERPWERLAAEIEAIL